LQDAQVSPAQSWQLLYAQQTPPMHFSERHSLAAMQFAPFAFKAWHDPPVQAVQLPPEQSAQLL
jgi:hypothetical protein